MDDWCTPIYSTLRNSRKLYSYRFNCAFNLNPTVGRSFRRCNKRAIFASGARAEGRNGGGGTGGRAFKARSLCNARPDIRAG